MNNIHNPLPPSEVLEALIALRRTADSLIQNDDSQEMWPLHEDDLMRHCHLFIKRTKAWHQTRQS